jgi:hypothetical protein
MRTTLTGVSGEVKKWTIRFFRGTFEMGVEFWKISPQLLSVSRDISGVVRSWLTLLLILCDVAGVLSLTVFDEVGVDFFMLELWAPTLILKNRKKIC